MEKSSETVVEGHTQKTGEEAENESKSLIWGERFVEPRDQGRCFEKTVWYVEN